MATKTLTITVGGGYNYTADSGTGDIARTASPTFTGTLAADLITATSVNKVALTTPATASTLTVADGKTLTASNTLTLAGTDGSTLTCGAGGTIIYASDNISALTASTSAQFAAACTDEEGTGALVFNNAPNLIAPVLGECTGTKFNGLTINSTTSGVLTIANNSTLATSGAFERPLCEERLERI